MTVLSIYFYNLNLSYMMRTHCLVKEFIWSEDLIGQIANRFTPNDSQLIFAIN